jgi:DNA-binding beta-propeller fold protein YncE
MWVPVGNTGSVDVLDVASGTFTRVNGFKTAELERRGKKHVAGPSAVSIGDGFAYIGNRASRQVCAVNSSVLKLAKCAQLSSSTDGVAYVAASREVWVTTPHDDSLAVLDASDPADPRPRAVIKLPGRPEGYAVDEKRGLFFTNLEDKALTVVVDVKTRKQIATWKPGCGSAGPRGLAFDAARRFLVVACTDRIQVLDAGHDGAPLGKLDTGSGVDNIDYLEARGLVFVAASRAARLTIARLDAAGRLHVVATARIAVGARSVAADAAGNAYVADPPEARLLVVANPRR